PIPLPPRSTLFPYTTLFRSLKDAASLVCHDRSADPSTRGADAVALGGTARDAAGVCGRGAGAASPAGAAARAQRVAAPARPRAHAGAGRARLHRAQLLAAVHLRSAGAALPAALDPV